MRTQVVIPHPTAQQIARMTRTARDRSSGSWTFSARIFGSSSEMSLIARDRSRIRLMCETSTDRKDATAPSRNAGALRNDERKLICGDYILQHYDPPWSMAS